MTPDQIITAKRLLKWANPNQWLRDFKEDFSPTMGKCFTAYDPDLGRRVWKVNPYKDGDLVRQWIRERLDGRAQYDLVATLLLQNFDYGHPAEFFNYDRPHMWMDVLSLIIADAPTLCEALAKVVLEGERNHA